MTYETTDESIDSARPLLLLEFADDFGNYWRYNTGTLSETFQGEVYIPDRCKVSEPELAINAFRNSLKITMERDNALGLLFVIGPLESKVSLTVYRLFDVDSGGDQFIFYWFGIINNVSFDRNARPVFTCDPRTTSVQRGGNRRVCQVMCDLPLYGTGTGACNVDKDNFKIEGTVTSVINGTTLLSAEFGDEVDGWLQGGEIVSGNSRRLILDHATDSGGTTITISRALRDPELDSGSNIVYIAYAGCAHTNDVCLNKFSNKKNYGGQEYLPTKNPFIGDSVI